MKLYFAPGACSLADHIALHEGGFGFDHVKVDLKTKKTADGADYLQINPKGYVPALMLDGHDKGAGEILTENVAILSWVADQRPALAIQSGAPLARFRLLEMLAFITSELHKQFKPFFATGKDGGSDEAKDAARKTILKRLDYLKDRMHGDFLFGTMSVADCYLFTMLTWTQKPEVGISHGLDGYFDRVKARPAVQAALEHEQK